VEKAATSQTQHTILFTVQMKTSTAHAMATFGMDIWQATRGQVCTLSLELLHARMQNLEIHPQEMPKHANVAKTQRMNKTLLMCTTVQ